MGKSNGENLKVRVGDVRIITDWLIFGIFKDAA
jgi:hypothetical protein